MLPREDVVCPACPDPEKAFRLEDVGLKVESQVPSGDGAARVVVSRPVWETVMLEHIASRSDDAHRELYAVVVAHLAEDGMVPEEAGQLAKIQVEKTVASVRSLLDSAVDGFLSREA